MFTRKRVAVFVVTITFMSLSGSAQAVPITPVLFLGGGLDQLLPSANANWMGYSSNTVSALTRYNAYVQAISGGVPTGSPMRVNAPNTFGWAADMQSDADVAAFQQTNAIRTTSTIYTVNVDSLPLVPVAPPGLNTPFWEWQPVISQHWILFGRNTSTLGEILLYNRTTHAITTLASPPLRKDGSPTVFPNDVSEDYATWTTCGSIGCNVRIYNLNTHVTSEVPNPGHTPYYDSSVSDATGDVYFMRSGHGCGLHAELFRWHIGDPPPYTVVSTLPAGYDSAGKTSTFNDGTHDIVSFARQRCAGKYYSDIYRVPAADTA